MVLRAVLKSVMTVIRLPGTVVVRIVRLRRVVQMVRSVVRVLGFRRVATGYGVRRSVVRKRIRSVTALRVPVRLLRLVKTVRRVATMSRFVFVKRVCGEKRKIVIRERFVKGTRRRVRARRTGKKRYVIPVCLFAAVAVLIPIVIRSIAVRRVIARGAQPAVWIMPEFPVRAGLYV